jgi:hypothetical protein
MASFTISSDCSNVNKNTLYVINLCVALAKGIEVGLVENRDCTAFVHKLFFLAKSAYAQIIYR